MSMVRTKWKAKCKELEQEIERLKKQELNVDVDKLGVVHIHGILGQILNVNTDPKVKKNAKFDFNPISGDKTGLLVASSLFLPSNATMTFNTSTPQPPKE